MTVLEELTNGMTNRVGGVTITNNLRLNEPLIASTSFFVLTTQNEVSRVHQSGSGCEAARRDMKTERSNKCLMMASLYLLFSSDFRDVVKAIFGLKSGKRIFRALYVTIRCVTHFKLTFYFLEPPQTFSHGRALERVCGVHKIVSQNRFQR
ncbi:hypothetical protein [Streptomyces sp. NPDC059943]|uniref:hypothetical protein n=1 Tax=Streptomyces sp. NPDC059943 TaxID=3347010 RepID=UPI00364C3CAB